jgi:hypothetical protein
MDVYGISATVSKTGGAIARMGANIFSPSAAEPRCVNRIASTEAPCSGGGRSGSAGRRCTATEVVASSGRVSNHSRHSGITAGTRSMSNHTAPP